MIKVQPNQNLVRHGDSLVRHAKEAAKKKAEYSNLEIGQSIKDACSYFKSKAKEKVYSIPGLSQTTTRGRTRTAIGFKMSQRRWDAIFNKSGQSNAKPR